MQAQLCGLISMIQCSYLVREQCSTHFTFSISRTMLHLSPVYRRRCRCQTRQYVPRSCILRPPRKPHSVKKPTPPLPIALQTVVEDQCASAQNDTCPAPSVPRQRQLSDTKTPPATSLAPSAGFLMDTKGIVGGVLTCPQPLSIMHGATQGVGA